MRKQPNPPPAPGSRPPPPPAPPKPKWDVARMTDDQERRDEAERVLRRTLMDMEDHLLDLALALYAAERQRRIQARCKHAFRMCSDPHAKEFFYFCDNCKITKEDTPT